MLRALDFQKYIFIEFLRMSNHWCLFCLFFFLFLFCKSFLIFFLFFSFLIHHFRFHYVFRCCLKKLSFLNFFTSYHSFSISNCCSLNSSWLRMTWIQLLLLLLLLLFSFAWSICVLFGFLLCEINTNFKTNQILKFCWQFSRIIALAIALSCSIPI